MNADDYALGWQQCSSDAGLCGAYNQERPPAPYCACVRPRGHTGKHDDFHTPPWGDPWGTGEQTEVEGRAEYRRVAGVVGRRTATQQEQEQT